MNLKERGVSPVVGTILLIAITVAAAGIVGYFVMSRPSPKPAPTVNVTFDNVKPDAGGFTIAHDGGDEVTDAFNSNASSFNNLAVTVNGQDQTLVDNTYVTGNDDPDWNVGEVMTIRGDSPASNFGGSNDNTLNSGDTIRVIHEPSGTILAKTSVV